ncbi:sensor domain-containing diguanylate cyclase [Marinimicrobium sp. C2-29]|uniref:sensor domain-containing diguanylate cyclase n=1 Tax=Marinimicrobium sp. C2-29 TaxID=3139825 RepID=UPI0031396F89
MKEPDIPANETDRLAALDQLAMVYSPGEERFDRITRLACRLFDVPIALVTLVSKDNQWFKSAQGLLAAETPKRISFCAHAINRDEAMVVPDTLENPDFADNPMVTNAPHIRFYAGQPIQFQGHCVGTLCLIDHEPRTLTAEQLDTLQSLAAWVENELRVASLSHEQAQLLLDLDEARRDSLIDPLTKCWNRQGMDVLLKRELATATREGSDVTLMLVDIDHFKEANDQWGHLAGDAFLVEVAQRIRSAVRPQDVVARYGGDEFVVFAARCPEEMAGFLGRRVVSRVSAQPVVTEQGVIPLTLSIGIAAAQAHTGLLMNRLISVADRALYDVKASGRNGQKVQRLT